MTSVKNPLTEPPPEDVPLPGAPLEVVLVQVRFPLIVSFDSQEFLGKFQEALRSVYPSLQCDQNKRIKFGNEGPVEVKSDKVWRFSDKDDIWQVSLASNFMALQTREYASRTSFMKRFKEVLEALSLYKLGLIDRIGIRYVNRLDEEGCLALPDLVRPEIAGVMATGFASATKHSICENLFDLGQDRQLATRWGVIPAGKSVDPSVMRPYNTRSWLLDLDAFKMKKSDFNVEEILEETEFLATRIYSMFRWVVTDAYLQRFGG